MCENIYFITINNIKHKFELNDSSLQFCPDEKDEEEEKKSTTKDEEKENSSHTPNIMPKLLDKNDTLEIETLDLLEPPKQEIEPPKDE